MPYYNKELSCWEDYLAVFDKIHENLMNRNPHPRPVRRTGEAASRRQLLCWCVRIFVTSSVSLATLVIAISTSMPYSIER